MSFITGVIGGIVVAAVLFGLYMLRLFNRFWNNK